MSTQTEWNTAAALFNGLAVCGCKGKTINGQVLFRLVNYARTIAGLGITNTAPAIGPSASIPQFIVLQSPPSVPSEQITIDWSNFITQSMIIIQQGKGLANPWLVQPGLLPFQTLLPGAPFYAELKALCEADALMPTCCWNYGDGPSQVGNCIFVHVP